LKLSGNLPDSAIVTMPKSTRGDILEFTDKWEWYRSKYGVDMMFAAPDKKAELQAAFDAEPMERRLVSIPDCYEEFSADDLKSNWQIIGNVFENPELLAEAK
jgi:hypothetical protein